MEFPAREPRGRGVPGRRRLAGVPDELREMAGGIHPPILAEGDLGPALRTLARGSSIPAKLEVMAEGRLPDPVEVARPTMSHQNR